MPGAAAPPLPAPNALVRAVAVLTAGGGRGGAPSAAEADAHRTLALYLDDPATADVAFRVRPYRRGAVARSGAAALVRRRHQKRAKPFSLSC